MTPISRPMATEAASVYFEQYEDGNGPQAPVVTEFFTSPVGWQVCPERPELTPALVQEMHADGVLAVLLSAHGRHADFTVMPAGPLSPAYLR